MFKNILVPIDGSDVSTASIKPACSFAKEISARLTFYFAKPDYFPTYIFGELILGSAGVDQAFFAAMEKKAEILLRDAAQAASDAGIECETLSDSCDAFHAGIIAAAERTGCDLIFMASHGRRGTSALLLGSETQKVLTHCKIPVLVYR
jgi:nucleotide-binding universal stress UspA family protein